MAFLNNNLMLYKLVIRIAKDRAFLVVLVWEAGTVQAGDDGARDCHAHDAGANVLHLEEVFDMFLCIQVLTGTLRGSYIYFYFVDQKSKA